MTKLAEDAGQAPEAVARMLPANAADCAALGKNCAGAPAPGDHLRAMPAPRS